jgi:hypothetical protein
MGSASPPPNQLPLQPIKAFRARGDMLFDSQQFNFKKLSQGVAFDQLD